MEFKKSKISLEDFILFNRQLASMVKIDLPIPESLEKISAIMKKKKIGRILEEVIYDIKNGWSFSKAITRQQMYFPPLYLSMIKVGEETGNLSKVLHQLIAHFHEIDSLRKKVINALTYPTIIMAIAFLIIIYLLTVTVPSFTTVFESFGASLPLPTRTVIFIALFVRDNILIMVGIGMAFLLMILLLVRTEQGRFIIDTIWLKIPLVGNLWRDYLLFYFCRTLGDLLTAGVPIVEALELTKEVLKNKVLKSALIKIREGVIEGKMVSHPLEKSSVFPATLIWMMKVGEKRGDLDEVLLEIGEFYHQQTISRADLLTKLIEPVLIVFLGMIVGAIVIVMFLPIFMMSSIIGD